MAIIRLEGNWQSGFAFDKHTLSSVYTGDDELGRPQFMTTRSPMGEHLYHLKYREDRSRLPLIIGLLETVNRIEMISQFNYIIPIPPSNRHRPFQPVIEIALKIGQRYDVPVLTDYLVKNLGSSQIKNISDPRRRQELLEQSMSIQGTESVRDLDLLLVDDLFRSGATLTVATKLLHEQGGANKVSVLTMTKTRSTR